MEMSGETMDSVQINPSEKQEILLKNFQYQPFPKNDLLGKLSTDTGLPINCIQNWFSEKRKLLKIKDKSGLKENDSIENSLVLEEDISKNSLEEEENSESENQELMNSWLTKFQKQNTNEEQDDTNEDKESEKVEEQTKNLSLKQSLMNQISEELQRDIDSSEISEEANILKDQQKHDSHKESEETFTQEGDDDNDFFKESEETHSIEENAALGESMKICTPEDTEENSKIQESESSLSALDVAVKSLLDLAENDKFVESGKIGKLDKIINKLKESEVHDKNNVLNTDSKEPSDDTNFVTYNFASQSDKFTKNNSIKQDRMSIQEAFERAYLYNDLKIKYDKLLESFLGLEALRKREKALRKRERARNKGHVSINDTVEVSDSTMGDESTAIEVSDSTMRNESTMGDQMSEGESPTLNEITMRDMGTVENESIMINASSLLKDKTTLDESSMEDESNVEDENTMEDESSMEDESTLNSEIGSFGGESTLEETTVIKSEEEDESSLVDSTRIDSTRISSTPPTNDLTSTFSPTDGSTPINPKYKAHFKINNPHSLMDVPEESEETEFIDASNSMHFEPPIHSTMKTDTHFDIPHAFPPTAPPPQFPNYPQFPYQYQQVPTFSPYGQASYPEYVGQMYYNPPYSYPPMPQQDQLSGTNYPHYNYNPYPYYSNPYPALTSNNPEQFVLDPRTPTPDVEEEIEITENIQPVTVQLASPPAEVAEIPSTLDQLTSRLAELTENQRQVKDKLASRRATVTENQPQVKDQLTSQPAKVTEKLSQVKEQLTSQPDKITEKFSQVKDQLTSQPAKVTEKLSQVKCQLTSQPANVTEINPPAKKIEIKKNIGDFMPLKERMGGSFTPLKANMGGSFIPLNVRIGGTSFTPLKANFATNAGLNSTPAKNKSRDSSPSTRWKSTPLKVKVENFHNNSPRIIQLPGLHPNPKTNNGTFGTPAKTIIIPGLTPAKNNSQFNTPVKNSSLCITPVKNNPRFNTPVKNNSQFNTPVRNSALFITPVKNNAQYNTPGKKTGVIQSNIPLKFILPKTNVTKNALPVSIQGKIPIRKSPINNFGSKPISTPIEKFENTINVDELMSEDIQESEATLDEVLKEENAQNVERKKGSRYVWQYEEGLPEGWKITYINGNSTEASVKYFLTPDGVQLRSKRAVIKHFLSDPKITEGDIEKFEIFYMNEKLQNNKSQKINLASSQKEESRKQKNPPSIGLSVSKKQKLGTEINMVLKHYLN